MERVSTALMSTLMKPLPDHAIILEPPDLPSQAMPSELSNTDQSQSNRLIAPSLNLTFPEEENEEERDSIDLPGFGGIVGDLEKPKVGDFNHHPTPYSKVNTPVREIFHLNHFNVIGEDYVAGVGNVGSIHDMDDFEADPDDPRVDLPEEETENFDRRGSSFEKGTAIIGLNELTIPDRKESGYPFDLFSLSTVPPPPLLRHHHNKFNKNNWNHREDKHDHRHSVFDMMPSM